MLKRVLFVIPVVLVAYAISSTGARAAFESRQNQPTSSPQHQHDQTSPSNRADMMKMHQQMVADMKAADAKLDQLLSRMDTATADVKTSAIADVVHELARQQKGLHGHMGEMDEQMMNGRGMMMKQ